MLDGQNPATTDSCCPVTERSKTGWLRSRLAKETSIPQPIGRLTHQLPFCHLGSWTASMGARTELVWLVPEQAPSLTSVAGHRPNQGTANDEQATNPQSRVQGKGRDRSDQWLQDP